MKRLLLFLALITLLTNCRKTPDFDELSAEFIVSTSQDVNANFSAYKTYYLSDTIRYIGGVGDDSILVGPKAQPLIDAVNSNLATRGYTLVGRNNSPDLGLTLTAIKDINIVISGYPGWWDPYWGYCYWYYWCYPYYYPWTAVYSYTTGTVILNMYDLKNANHDEQIKALWNITALGALGSSTDTKTQQAVNALNQGFVQSPYVKTN